MNDSYNSTNISVTTFVSSATTSTPVTPPFASCSLDLQKAELPPILFTTFTVNVVAFVVLLRMRGICDSVDHLLVSLLNINDLLTTAMFIVMWLTGVASCGELLLIDEVCSVFGWLGTALVTWSAFIIVIMSSVRCISLVKPFYYRSHINCRVVTRAAAGTLLYCIVLYLFPFTGLGKPFLIYSNNLVCGLDFAPGGSTVAHRAFIGSLAMMSILTTAIVLVCNFLIIVTLRQKNIIHTISLSVLPASNVNNAVVKRRMFQRVTLIVSLVYVFCYLPFAIRVLWDTVRNFDHQNDLIHSVTLSLLFLSPFLNPFVYGLFNKGFRDTLIRMVTCRQRPTSSSCRRASP